MTPEPNQKYRCGTWLFGSLGDEYTVTVLRVETSFVLVEIEGEQDQWGYPLRRWWPMGWFTIDNRNIDRL